MLNKILFIIVTIITIFTFTSEIEAASNEYPYLYKSPRAMGMGGAYIAIGGRVDTLFYNPAGLGKMPENDWEVNILSISGEAGKNALDFTSDLQDAFDTGDIDKDGESSDDQIQAVNDVFAKFRGENLHLSSSVLLPTLGKNYGTIAFGMSSVGRVKLDAVTHQGFGSDGLLEVNADATYGAIGGFSYNMYENLFLGASLKYLSRESLIHTFTSREIVEHQDNLEDLITDELKASGNAFGIDIGAIYKFSKYTRFKPAAGISILNIGDLDFGNAGKLPMTVNLGTSINPEIPIFGPLTIGLDYVDLFNGYDQDSDIGKRIRLGGELQLFDKKLASMAVRLGLYQGYPTAGVDLELFIITLSYVTYAEEVGAHAGQDDDRRHLVTLNIGW